MIAPLTFVDVHFHRGTQVVLDGFSLTLAAGEVVALMGPSGAGKSTVLRLALGLEAPTRGEVRLGKTAASTALRVLVPPEARQLGIVFQDLALWPHLTVAGNLDFVLAARGVRRHNRAPRIAAMLDEVGLRDKAALAPGQLSGGERQRVAIARALVAEPAVILLDEPLSNLDVHLRAELIATFKALLRDRRGTALYVTHALDEAAALAHRIAVLEQGRIVQQGTLAELREAPVSAFVRALTLDRAPPP